MVEVHLANGKADERHMIRSSLGLGAIDGDIS
jgi:hypothetical protein